MLHPCQRFKKLCTASLCLYALLASPTSSSTHSVKDNREQDHTCTDGPSDTCHIYCDDTKQGGFDTTFDCGNAGECYFHCEQKKCAETATVIGNNAHNLYIQLGDSGEECMKTANVYAPLSGSAYFDMGNSKRGFKGMNVYSESGTQNIIITMLSSNVAGDDCKEMQVFGAEADFVKITLGNGLEWQNGRIECPIMTGPYTGLEPAPCVIDASQGTDPDGILLDTHIIARDGIPKNVYINGGNIQGNTTISCHNIAHALSTAPFDTLSDCWWTNAPTSDPTVQPTYNPTPAPSVNPTPAPTINPTETPSVSPTTSHPTLGPTSSSTSPTTETPTQYPTAAPTTENPSKPPSTSPTPSAPTALFTTTPSPILNAGDETTNAYDITDTEIFLGNTDGLNESVTGDNHPWDIAINLILMTLLSVVICLCAVCGFLICFVCRKRKQMKQPSKLKLSRERSSSSNIYANAASVDGDGCTIPMGMASHLKSVSTIEMTQFSEGPMFNAPHNNNQLPVLPQNNDTFQALDQYGKNINFAVKPHIEESNSDDLDTLPNMVESGESSSEVSIDEVDTTTKTASAGNNQQRVTTHGNMAESDESSPSEVSIINAVNTTTNAQPGPVVIDDVKPSEYVRPIRRNSNDSDDNTGMYEAVSLAGRNTDQIAERVNTEQIADMYGEGDDTVIQPLSKATYVMGNHLGDNEDDDLLDDIVGDDNDHFLVTPQ